MPGAKEEWAEIAAGSESALSGAKVAVAVATAEARWCAALFVRRGPRPGPKQNTKRGDMEKGVKYERNLYFF